METPWTYTFTRAQLATLQSGSVAYTVVQTGDFQVESGVTTLTIITAPEPAAFALIGGGLALPVFARRKKRA